MNGATRSPLDVRRCGSTLVSIGALSALIVILFFPGVMTNDSEATLRQARTMELTDWHPPIMALVWRYLDAVIRGPLLMLVVQALLYAWATAKLCVEAFPSLTRRVPAWALMLVFGLFPPAMALIGMIWKDVWMSGLLLLGLGHLYAMANTDIPTERIRNFVILVICCALATAFRHNAVAATAGLLAGGCYFLIPPGMQRYLRLFLGCCGGLLLAVVLWAGSGVFTRLVTSPSHPTTSILLHDIAGTIVNAGDPGLEAAHLLEHHSAVSSLSHKEFMRNLKRSYRPGSANGVLRSSRRTEVPFDIIVYDSTHDAASVRSAWRDLVSRNPSAYLSHRQDAFRCLLQLCGTGTWASRSYVLNPDYLGTESSSAVQAKLRHVLLSSSLVRLYSPLFWLGICIAVGSVALCVGKERRIIPFFMGLSGFGLAFSLFFTVPIESYRYMHWTILVGWACLFVILDATLARRRNELSTTR